MLLVALSAGARPRLGLSKLSPDWHNYIAIWAELPYSTYLNSTDFVSMAPGTAPTVGFGYKLYYNRLIFSTGMEMQYAYMQNGISNKEIIASMLDTEGEPFSMHAYLTDGDDYVQSLSVGLPLLLGFEYERFYFLVGPVLQYNVFGRSAASYSLRTTAEYDAFVDHFADMPNHLLISGQPVVSSVQPVSLGFNALAHFEVGACVNTFHWKRGYDVRMPQARILLSAYVECDVLGIGHGRVSGSMLDFVQTDKGPQFVVNPVLTSKDAADAAFRRLNVGAKLSVMIDMPRRQKGVYYRDVPTMRSNRTHDAKKSRNRYERDPFE